MGNVNFERNEQLSLLVDQLYEMFASKERGETVGHNEIAKILGVAPHQEHWQTCLIALKRRMEERKGITVWCEREVGYRLLTPREQITFAPIARIKRASRQLRKAEGHVCSILDGELSPHQRRIRNAQMESIRQSREEVEYQMKRARAMIADRSTRPIPERPQAEARA